MDEVFVVGCCQFPKDIPVTVSHGKAAAANALELVDKGSVVTEPATSCADDTLCHGCGICEETFELKAPRVVLKGGKRVSMMNEALCECWGLYAVACKSGAMSIDHLKSYGITTLTELVTAVTDG